MRHNQNGMVLVLGLLLLASLSLLGFAAASDGLLQQRVAGNQAAAAQLQKQADAALQGVEEALRALPGDARPAGCPDRCLPDPGAQITLEEIHFEPAGPSGAAGLSWFRITATFGDFASPGAASQSLFARPWGDAAWSGRDLCAKQESNVACGRQAWRRVL